MANSNDDSGVAHEHTVTTEEIQLPSFQFGKYNWKINKELVKQPTAEGDHIFKDSNDGTDVKNRQPSRYYSSNEVNKVTKVAERDVLHGIEKWPIMSIVNISQVNLENEETILTGIVTYNSTTTSGEQEDASRLVEILYRGDSDFNWLIVKLSANFNTVFHSISIKKKTKNKQKMGLKKNNQKMGL